MEFKFKLFCQVDVDLVLRVIYLMFLVICHISCFSVMPKHDIGIFFYRQHTKGTQRKSSFLLIYEFIIQVESIKIVLSSQNLQLVKLCENCMHWLFKLTLYPVILLLNLAIRLSIRMLHQMMMNQNCHPETSSTSPKSLTMDGMLESHGE